LTKNLKGIHEPYLTKILTWYQRRLEENHCTLQIEGKVCCSVELKRVKPLIEKSMVVNKVGPLVTNMW